MPGSASPGPTSRVVIEACGVVKGYGTGAGRREVLHGVDLEVRAGEFVAVMGPSGSGKSTLLYCLAGLDRADAGTVRLGGADIGAMRPETLAIHRRAQCGFVFQQPFLVDSMSLMDNALSAALLVEKNKARAVRRTDELFESVGLDAAVRRRLPAHVSGGEAARAGIVRAVVNSPSVVFADEPTGALNSEASAAVLDVLSILAESGQTIVMVTHDRTSAVRADRIVYLRDGATCGELALPRPLANPARHEALDGFLKEMGW